MSMRNRFRRFGEITKVVDEDDGTIRVYGVASSETRDEAGEIITAAAMRAALPGFTKFPALREMHNPSAAGRVEEAEVDDGGLTQICAHVVDPIAIEKVKHGVYAGFSVGGKVIKRDPTDRTIITEIKLVEISLVDSPCNTDATLNMWKMDMADYNPTAAAVVAEAKRLAAAAGHGRYKDHLYKAREALIKTAMEADLGDDDADAPADPVVVAAPVVAVVDDAVVVVAVAPAPVAEIAPPADAVPIVDNVTSPAVNVVAEPVAEAIVPPVEDDKETAAPAAAITEVGNPISDPAAALAAALEVAKALTAEPEPVVAGWVAKVDPEGPPSPERLATFGDLGKASAALALLAARADTQLVKGMYSVSRLAAFVEEFGYLQSSLAYEAASEGDGSSQPADAAAIVASLCSLLVNMVAEETAEIVAGYADQGIVLELVPVDGDDVDLFAYANTVIDTVKADEALMTKVGARNSQTDAAHLQAAHDHMTKMGATCDSANCPADDAKDAALVIENARLNKALTDATPAVEELTKTIGDLTKRLELVEATPAAPKALVSTLRSVSKVEDVNPAADTPEADMTGEEWRKEFEKLSQKEQGEFMLKYALRNPMVIPTNNGRIAA